MRLDALGLLFTWLAGQGGRGISITLLFVHGVIVWLQFLSGSFPTLKDLPLQIYSRERFLFNILLFLWVGWQRFASRIRLVVKYLISMFEE